ncbi:MAG: hypothetical protein AMJ79_00170 [Phycisphaerae bacterium SM23_30]|nr:MAG: hypothetical protein AMJ79_00170 [Phycisphaerae bacterium SM23_30]
MALSLATTILTPPARAHVTDFDDLILAPQSYWNGADSAGGFTSGSASFNNSYSSGTGWEYWEGFAYSNLTDTSVSGPAGQYSASAGSGQSGSANYALAFVGWSDAPTVTLNRPTMVKSLYVTNNNYAYYSMLHGDMFSKKFGGAAGDDPDWFKLTITGKNAAGQTAAAKDFYLADFRFTDPGQDYIVNTWRKIDLTSLGTVKSLEFTLTSSDTGAFGMNTPAYFALDSITAIPAPAAILLGSVGITLVGWFRKREIL